MNYINKAKTILCDIDGTLVKHDSQTEVCTPTYKMIILNGVRDKLVEWEKKGYRIILITGRKESMREVTERQLSEVGIFYDQLVMGIGGGKRVLINDKKPDGSIAASVVNIDRNVGIGGVDE